MRIPNYEYLEDPKGGWEIKIGDVLVWGRTKPAARSKMLRLLKHKYKGKTTEEIYQDLKGNGGQNDQS